MTRITWVRLKVLGGFMLAVLVIVYLVANAWGDKILMLTGTLGGILGWISGILLSPKDKDEARTFADFRAGIAAFLGGAVAVKIEQFVQEFIEKGAPDLEQTATFALYFAIAFGLGLMMTWVGRMSDDAFPG